MLKRMYYVFFNKIIYYLSKAKDGIFFQYIMILLLISMELLKIYNVHMTNCKVEI